jgi:SNF2 family DNA or RNA helicase
VREKKKLKEMRAVRDKGHAKSPWPYQMNGARFLQTRGGALLGDQVGLGKTLQAIIAVQKCGLPNVLLVVPNSHKKWWIQEIIAQERIAFDVQDVKIELLGNLPVVQIIFSGGKKRVWIVAHHEALRINSPYFKVLDDVQWGTVIVDEVHKISNHETQRAKGLNALKSWHRWGLTGSPIADKPDSLWGLLHWIAPDKFTNKWAFIKEHFYVYETWGGNLKLGACINPAKLQLVTAPYLLVRKLEDVGIELPEITPVEDRPVPLELMPLQQKYYDKVENEARIDLMTQLGIVDVDPEDYELYLDLDDDGAKWITNALSRFTACHRAASLPPTDDNAKMEWLREYVENGGEPAVIFTRYVATKDAIIEKLMDWLPKEEASKYIVGTYAYMSHGHNLQHLHVLIQWDLSWSRIEYEQSIGRVHRQGQLHPVQAYELQCENTVDMYIAELVHNKQATAEMLLKWLRKEEEYVDQ